MNVVVMMLLQDHSIVSPYLSFMLIQQKVTFVLTAIKQNTGAFPFLGNVSLLQLYITNSSFLVMSNKTSNMPPSGQWWRPNPWGK